MLEKNNLIFLPPYSEALIELKDELEKIADLEGFELMEMADILEANQIIPTIGPSLTILSTAKTCAQLLKTNSKYLKDLKSKVILITPQMIPDNTVNKLVQIGLTEYIQEPIQIKSLLYKTKLILNNLPKIEVEDEGSELDDQVIHSDLEDENLDTHEKQRMEKGILAEEELGELHKNETTDNNLNVINTQMKSNVAKSHMNLKLDFEKEKEENLEDQSKSSNEKKGEFTRKDVNNIEINFESDEKNKEKSPREKDSNSRTISEKDLSIKLDKDLKKSLKDEINLQLETELEQEETEKHKKNENIARKNKGDLKIDFDDEPKKKKNNEIDLKLSDNQEENRKKEEKKSENDNQRISSGDDLKMNFEKSLEEDLLKKKTRDDENTKVKKLKDNLILENGENPINNKESRNSNKPGYKITKKETKASEGKDEIRKKKLQLDIISEEDKENKKQSKEKELTLKRIKDLKLKAEEIKKEKKKSTLSLREEENNKKTIKEKKETDTNVRDNSKETSLKKEENKSKKKKKNDKDLNKEETSDLELSLTEELSKLENKNKKNDKETKDRKRDITLEIEKDKDTSESIPEEELERKKKESQNIDLRIHKSKHGFTEEITLDLMKGEGKVDHIDNKFKSKKHTDIRIDFGEKKDLGEQTIDYRKLKKEFVELAQQLALQPDFDPKASENKNESLYKKDHVYTPQSKGIEFAIQIQQAYLEENNNDVEIFYLLSNIFKNEFHAKFAILIIDNETNEFIDHHQTFQDEEVDLKEIPIEQRWSSILPAHIDSWKEVTLPCWEDDTFKNDHNKFIFPFFENSVHLGFSIVAFEDIIDKDLSGTIEVLMESLRGVVLEIVHNGSSSPKSNEVNISENSSNTKQEKSKDKTTTEKVLEPKMNKGFMSNLFGEKR